jgi:2-polyprenyl-3-methyl-5-hydroxy-6-metoxy-1,4-benzoquinol methylase
MHSNHEAPPCRACGVPTTLLSGSDSVHPLLCCNACGFRSIADPHTVKDVSVEQSESEYLQSYSREFGDVARRRIETVRSLVPPPAKCLDFGSSYGLIAEELGRLGYEISTFEKSPQALASMRRRGFTAYDRIGDLPRRSFDVITVWHVLEHLEEPDAILTVLAECLKPGGKVIVAVPNAESLFARLSFDHWIWTMPWHLHYFTKTSLQRMMDRSGLSVKSTTTDIGDVAALELLVGGVVLRTPSRLSRQNEIHGSFEASSSTIRRIGAPVLRLISKPMQQLAKRAGSGEELIAHAVKS